MNAWAGHPQFNIIKNTNPIIILSVYNDAIVKRSDYQFTFPLLKVKAIKQ